MLTRSPATLTILAFALLAKKSRKRTISPKRFIKNPINISEIIIYVIFGYCKVASNWPYAFFALVTSAVRSGIPPTDRDIASNLQALFIQARHEIHSASSGDSLNFTPIGQTL